MEEKRQDGRAQREIDELLALFPKVKPEEVPPAVWQQVKEGRPLALAYCLHLLEEAQAELKELRGKRLSTGSVGSAGTDNAGTLAAYWDAYEM